MKKKKHFTEEEALFYLTQLLLALEYLHSKDLIHRDLKPSNILIETCSDGLIILKVGDLALSIMEL